MFKDGDEEKKGEAEEERIDGAARKSQEKGRSKKEGEEEVFMRFYA